MLQNITIILLIHLTIQYSQTEKSKENAQNPHRWHEAAKRGFSHFKSSPLYGPFYRKATPPKSVIIFVGDGMGASTVTGARYMKAHEEKELAGDIELTWDSWPTASHMHTFNADRMTTDSASAATAMFSGTKVVRNAIGLFNRTKCCECSAYHESQQLQSIFMHAQESGLSTGFITTTSVTHATPAAVYAHSPDRYSEYLSTISKMDGNFVCEDIASQLVSKGINLNVVLGGGSGHFYETPDELTPEGSGKREDGKNLLKEWKLEQTKRNRSHLLVTDGRNFSGLDLSNVDYLFGVLSPGHMPYDIERVNEPSLAQMTEAALEILERNSKGFLLMVEGGRIDHGHHVNRAKVALTDTLAMDKAVQLAVEKTDQTSTLVIVTADHAQSYGIVGYGERTKSVLDFDDTQKPMDGLPMLISSYYTGPGAAVNESRQDPRQGNHLNASYQQQALVPMFYGTHVAEDVPFYATGPFNELFHRPLDNTFLAHATMFSLCIGSFGNEPHCHPTSQSPSLPNSLPYIQLLIVIFITIFKLQDV